MNSKTTLSQISLQRLNECHPILQELITEVSKTFPLIVVCSFRNEADQNKAFNEGKSKLAWPNSKHNQVPSLAVDIAPLPYDPKDRVRILYLAGCVRGVSYKLGIQDKIRWGGDWDSDLDQANEKFRDLYHFEIL